MNHLKLQSTMLHGSAVRRLQELGDLIGCDTGDNDGIFGRDTHNAVLAIQNKVGVKQDGVVGPVTWKALIGYADKQSNTTLDRSCVDIRNSHARVKNWGRLRTWKQIDGVTLHQTGCGMPSNPRGWSRVNAHVGILQNGTWVLLNDFTDMIWHGQGLSKHTIGIEIEGNYQGVNRRPSTLWKGGGPACHLNDKMIAALDDVFDFIKEQFELNSSKWLTVHAHRQSSASRKACPGSEIWKAVALPWMDKLERREMDGGPDWHLPKGRPIPKQWNPEYKDKY